MPAADWDIDFIDGHADVWAIFRDGERFGRVVAALAAALRPLGLTKVAGVEARGFLLGGAVATKLGVGFAAIRKSDGLFPGPKVHRATTSPDYRGKTHELLLQRASIGQGDRVVLVDDWAESGNQARAARSMIEQCGAAFLGLTVIVNQLAEDSERSLEPVRFLVRRAGVGG